MFRISNNDFQILVKYKCFLDLLDGLLENVPRKDLYFKDKIRTESLELLGKIMEASYHEDNESYFEIIKAKIAMIDFLLERLLTKKYASEKAIYKIGSVLVEINKMVTGWLKHDS